jgi:alpha-galactosidase
MLLVGNHGKGKATSAKGMFKGLTQEEYKTHFMMWGLLNAPLLTSCDLRNISKEDFDIITNTLPIELNQDQLGEQAKLVKKKGGLWYYQKKLSYSMQADLVFNTTNKTKVLSKDVSIPAHGVHIAISNTK